MSAMGNSQGPRALDFFFLNLLILLTLGAQSDWIKADPVVAFSNQPPPVNFKLGGFLLGTNAWKSQLLKTPAS